MTHPFNDNVVMIMLFSCLVEWSFLVFASPLLSPPTLSFLLGFFSSFLPLDVYNNISLITNFRSLFPMFIHSFDSTIGMSLLCCYILVHFFVHLTSTSTTTLCCSSRLSPPPLPLCSSSLPFPWLSFYKRILGSVTWWCYHYVSCLQFLSLIGCIVCLMYNG